MCGFGVNVGAQVGACSRCGWVAGCDTPRSTAGSGPTPGPGEAEKQRSREAGKQGPGPGAHHDELGHEVDVVVAAGAQRRRRLLPGAEALKQLQHSGGAVAGGTGASSAAAAAAMVSSWRSGGSNRLGSSAQQPTILQMQCANCRRERPATPTRRRSAAAHLVQVERGRLSAVVVVPVDVQHLQGGAGGAGVSAGGRAPIGGAAQASPLTFSPSTDSRPLMMHSFRPVPSTMAS